MNARFRTVMMTGAAAGATLAIVGCGPSPSVSVPADGATGAYEEFDAVPEGERETALVEAAEQEGAVTVYLRADDVFADIEAAFEAEYDIDLTLVNPGRIDVVRQQVLEQAAAGRMEADVIEVFPSELSLIYGAQGIAAPVPSFIADAAADPSLASEFAVETFQYPWVPIWNTDLVTGDQVPTSYEDFLDPFWKDKLVIASGNQDWYLGWFQILTEQGDMTVEEFEELFSSIAANTSVVDSNNPASAGVASGEYYADPATALVTAQRIGNEAPLTWEPTFEQTVVSPVGIGFMAAAPHPAAGMLFAQWYLSEGSDILAKEQFVAQNPKETDLKGAELYRPDFSSMTTEQLNEWRIAYDNLVKGGESILPEYVRE